MKRELIQIKLDGNELPVDELDSIIGTTESIISKTPSKSTRSIISRIKSSQI